MKWVRSPGWDAFWFLSGIPFALVLTFLSPWVSGTTLILWLVLATQTGHLLSPMALAWTHGDFRALMLRRPVKFLAVPAAILVVATLISMVATRYIPDLRFDPKAFAIAAGPTTLVQLENPFFAMVALYTAWNAYHFGKQAFGVMSIYRRKHGNGHRSVDLFYSCAVIWLALALPFVPRIAQGINNLTGWPGHPHPFLDYVRFGYLVVGLFLPLAMLAHEWFTTRSLPRALFILTDGIGLLLVFHAGLWGFAIIGLNHWLVAIGIASHVHANHQGRSPWPFAIAVMVAGFALFCLLFVNLGELPTLGLTTTVLSFSVAAVGFRLGLGFVHFLYDRWLYKFSDSRVRETIGRDMFMVIQNDRSPDRDSAKVPIGV